MKTQKGVTLVILVITLVVLAILTGVAINVGTKTYENAELTAYVSTMNMIQSRVNVINTQMKQGDTTYINTGIALNRLNDDLLSKITTALNGKSQDGFRYYAKEQLEELGIYNIEEKVIINLDTTEIFSLVPIEYENVLYYNQYNLPNGIQVVDYTEIETEAPNFALTKDNYGLTATINIVDIVYDPQISGSEIYYAEVTDNTTSPVTIDYWRRVQGTSFSVTKTAEYAVKVVDRNGGETIKTIKIATCNTPEIVEGMIPVLYDETAKVWKKVDDSNLGQWYDYAEKKWANIMLSDGIEIEEDGTISTMGSMFVWIPRYAYCITSGYQQGGENVRGTIDIKFLKETTSLTTDEKTTKFSDVAGQGNWIIHPVFTDGSKNNYAEGGWDRELNGFWVAKFEASGLTNGNTGTAVGNASASSSTPVAPTENTIVKVLPNVISWRHITIGDSQYQSMQMCQNTVYGWANGSTDTHLIKNDEWGAVAYLCYSPYGNVPMANGAGVSAGSYRYNLYTGQGPDSTNSEEIYGERTDNRAYNTEFGVLASTTGNVYGVYDMAGGCHDYVSAFLDCEKDIIETRGNSVYATYFTNSKVKAEYAKYWNKYEVSSEEKNNAVVITRDSETGQITEQKTPNQIYSDINLSEEKYNAARLRITTVTWNNMSLCRGIGMNEVSGGFSYYGINSSGSFTQMLTTKVAGNGRAWDNDFMKVMYNKNAFIMRGGGVEYSSDGGVYCINYGQGNASHYIGFRPALVVNM